MFFFSSSLNQRYDIIICAYWFELFSQVSDVAHGPLVESEIEIDNEKGGYTDRSTRNDEKWGNYIKQVGATSIMCNSPCSCMSYKWDFKSNTSLSGRLTLSKIDGLNLFTGKMDAAMHFGGRGFSIWKTSDMSLVFDSGDEIEKELANSMKSVFNTDCIRNTITYQGPENLRDTQSDNYVSFF